MSLNTKLTVTMLGICMLYVSPALYSQTQADIGLDNESKAVDSVTPSDTPVLTLEECLEIALNTNPTITVADLEITRMDYTRKDVLAQLLPNVAFGANYSRTIAKQVAYMDFDMSSLMGGGAGAPDDSDSKSRASSNNSDGIKMGRDNSWQLGFNASLPLIAPQLWASLDLSDSQIAQSVEQARASRLNLINQVSNAYYQLLLAHDSKRVIQESYDMAKLTNEIYTKQFQAGAASEYDVLRTSVAMKNVEPELLQADIAVRRAQLQLHVLMGMPVEFVFDIAGQLADYENTMYNDALMLDMDYSNNTTLVMNTLQQNTMSQSLKVAKRAWYPTLALSASYNWTSSSNGSPFTGLRWSPYSVVGLTLNLPIYQGGSRWNKIKEAEIQVEQLRLTRDDLEKSVAMQVNLARDNVMLNVKQIASNAENVGQAERAHNIMEESFKIGAASYLELRDSELALTQTRLTYYQSIYNYLVARSELTLLLGRE
ncbi:MAG: TolC family protein [Muribaculaceae bacterium]|nr:TolC family protein [Muribaculaceae bacterium]